MTESSSEGSPVARKSSLGKKLLIALGVFVAIILVFAGIVAMQPSEFHVERTATISAPPEAVFAQVNDFHNWDAWSPWLELDPAAKESFEGPSEGEGAIFRWAGNANVGEGSMTITESRPHELIKIDLEFIKPFAGGSIAAFAFKPKGDETEVTWSMEGKNNFIAKAMCMFMDMDKMIGDNFEQGLAKMKSAVEKAPSAGEKQAPPPA